MYKINYKVAKMLTTLLTLGEWSALSLFSETTWYACYLIFVWMRDSGSENARERLGTTVVS